MTCLNRLFRNRPLGSLCLPMRGVLVFALGVLLFSGACTSVDDRLGADMILANQKMQTKVDHFTGRVETYLFKEDSIPSSRLGYGYFGRVDNGTMGVRTNSVVLQFLPTSVPYEDEDGYGLNPIVDSLCIVFSVSESRGDKTVVQRYEVWSIVEGADGDLTRDATYYANFPIDDYKGEKLFEFDDARNNKTNITAKLVPTAAGKDYLQKIVTPAEWSDYTDDEKFLANFKGLYITPMDGEAPGATFAADLASSGLVLYARNHDKTDPTAIYDTIVTSFSFRDTDAYDSQSNSTVVWDNVSVNMAAFDYSATEFTGSINDTLPTDTPLNKVYVQGMGGVGTYIRFPNEFIEDLRALKVNDKGEETDIEIDQAMMYIYLEDDSTPMLDNSLARVGSYLNLKSLEPVPDYQWVQEANNQSKDETYRLPYNGYLNRSGGYYELNITAYVQQVIKKEGDWGFRNMQKVMSVGPDALGRFAFGDSVMYGSDGTGEVAGEQPIKIRLTYTLIDKGGESK